MEITVDMNLKNGIITTPSGIKYFLYTILEAIEDFNKQCPKVGCIINRDHIGQMGKKTHITQKIEFKDNKLIATIEPLIDGLENAKIRPIVRTPLRLESGVLIERVLGIDNVYLEI